MCHVSRFVTRESWNVYFFPTKFMAWTNCKEIPFFIKNDSELHLDRVRQEICTGEKEGEWLWALLYPCTKFQAEEAGQKSRGCGQQQMEVHRRTEDQAQDWTTGCMIWHTELGNWTLGGDAAGNSPQHCSKSQNKNVPFYSHLYSF